MAPEDEASFAVGDGGGLHDPGHVRAAVGLRQGERTAAVPGQQPFEGAPVGGAGSIALEDLGHGVLRAAVHHLRRPHGAARGRLRQLLEHDQLVPDVARTVQADLQDAHLCQGPEQLAVERLGFVERVHAVLGGHVFDELANTPPQLGALGRVADRVQCLACAVGRAHHRSQCTTWAVSTRRPGLNSSPTVWATGIKAHCMTESPPAGLTPRCRPR